MGCHYFPPGLQLLPQPLRGLIPILLLGEKRHTYLHILNAICGVEMRSNLLAYYLTVCIHLDTLFS